MLLIHSPKNMGLNSHSMLTIFAESLFSDRSDKLFPFNSFTHGRRGTQRMHGNSDEHRLNSSLDMDRPVGWPYKLPPSSPQNIQTSYPTAPALGHYPVALFYGCSSSFFIPPNMVCLESRYLSTTFQHHLSSPMARTHVPSVPGLSPYPRAETFRFSVSSSKTSTRRQTTNSVLKLNKNLRETWRYPFSAMFFPTPNLHVFPYG